MLNLFRSSSAKKAEPRESRIADGHRVYVVGDIHGRADLLVRMLDMIRTDAALRPTRRNTLVFLGDYVDRGLESRQVIDILRTKIPENLDAVFLRGNHEDAMLRFLGGQLEMGVDWFGFGGRETMFSYGVPVNLQTGDMHAVEALRRRLEAALPHEHRAFLDNLKLMHVIDDYCFVHAGVRPGMALDRQDSNDLMWIRYEFLNSEADHGKMVVHGHTICSEPEIRANRIGIDTGAYATARLTCLVLEGAERRFLQT